MIKSYMKKIWEWIKKNKYYVGFYLFFLIIFLLVPLSGDDWGNYNPDVTIASSFNNAIHSYMTFESRIVSRFLINFLCYYKIIWALLNAFAITIIYWSITRLINIKNQLGFILTAIILMVIPCAMFGQVYVWVTGSITYLFPTALIIWYVTYLFKILKKFNWKNLIGLSFINMISSLFIDHCGVAIILANIIYIIYYIIEKKKIKPHLIIWLLFSIASLAVVYFAPGNLGRLANTTDFQNLSLFGKILENFTKFFDYIYYVNPTIIVSTLIPIIYVIWKKLKKNVVFKCLIIILLLIIPVWAIMYILPFFNPFIDILSSLDFYWVGSNFLNSDYAYVFWIIYSILFLYAIFYILDNKKDRIYHYSLLLIGLSPNVAMFMSPTWGFRTTYFTNVFMLMISCSLILKIIDLTKYKSKDLLILLRIFIILFGSYLLVNYVVLYHFDKVRIENIQEQYKSGERNIVIKICPLRYIWNYNPHMDYHEKTYKYLLKRKNVIDDIDIQLTFYALDRRSHVIKGW